MKYFLLPTRDMAFMPNVTVPMYLENGNVVRTINAAVRDISENNPAYIILVPQRCNGYPASGADLHNIGTLAHIRQVLRLPDNSVHVMLQTESVVNISNVTMMEGTFAANAEIIPQIDDSADPIVFGLRDAVVDALKRLGRGPLQSDLGKLIAVANDFPVGAFIDAVTHALGLGAEDSIDILKSATYTEKLTLLLEKIKMRAKLSELEHDITKKVHNNLFSGQKEIFLRERMAAIQKELGEGGDDSGINEIERKIKKSKMPEAVMEKVKGELRRLKSMNPYSSEGAMIRTYLEEITAMPWGKSDQTVIDLDAARKVLDADHYGMESVKERILEHLAVMKKTGSAKGTIICLVGQPGVGKTSLGRSIATALGRKYQRISLGGVSDEAHFRGHRRTYLGSQPGRIMDALKRAGADNPIILLDEIDKMGRDYRGDPESALLEILDPEQNKAFRDHYLEVDFDLSNVMFIATANTLKLSPALLDRMEIIEMPSYSTDEKVEIAKRHLLQNAAIDTGWSLDGITIGDDAIRHIINNHTNEAGVRNLRRELTALLRRALYQTNCEADSYEFTTQNVDELLKNIRPDIGRKIGFRTTSVRI